jgi:PPOX class probable F420-dependent enzyme
VLVASITDPDVRAFLTEGTRAAKFAYLSPAGRALVAPVWYIVGALPGLPRRDVGGPVRLRDSTGRHPREGEDLIFNTGKDTIKGRYLAHNRRVTLCVDLEKEPYGFVQAQGQAELSDDPGELLRTATAIAARYVGPDRAQEFGQRNRVPGELVVRVRPTKVLAYFNMTA